MIGLVLGIIRLPFIISTGISVTKSVGTNIGEYFRCYYSFNTTYKKQELSFTIFLVIALTGAIGAFCGALLIKYVNVNFFLILVGLIISYETITLLKDKINKVEKKTIKKNGNKFIKL
jgi:uncharacterized membrane protein YfcA